jgi:phosphocarrier protein HPr
MLSTEVEVVNALGLHARPSARLTALAGRFRSEVWISRGSRRVNAKSIMGVMMLAAARGSLLRLEADGPDEADAIEAIRALIADGFGERG